MKLEIHIVKIYGSVIRKNAACETLHVLRFFNDMRLTNVLARRTHTHLPISQAARGQLCDLRASDRQQACRADSAEVDVELCYSRSVSFTTQPHTPD